MASRTSHITALITAVGKTNALRILCRRALKAKAEVNIKLRGRELLVRPCDSDLFVIGQIFGKQEYNLGRYENRLRTLCKNWIVEGYKPVIIDVGANVGYSAIYFAEKFPEATVLAIEADQETYKLMLRNIEGIQNVTPLNVAVWSHEDGVDFSSSNELGSWAGRVGGGQGIVPSMLLRNTFTTIPNAMPLIIKLDVEGAEKEIAEEARDLLADVPCILVEPHDFMLPGSGVLSPMFEALSGRKIDTILGEEVIMFFESRLMSGVKL